MNRVITRRCTHCGTVTLLATCPMCGKEIVKVLTKDLDLVRYNHKHQAGCYSEPIKKSPTSTPESMKV